MGQIIRFDGRRLRRGELLRQNDSHFLQAAPLAGTALRAAAGRRLGGLIPVFKLFGTHCLRCKSRQRHLADILRRKPGQRLGGNDVAVVLAAERGFAVAVGDFENFRPRQKQPGIVQQILQRNRRSGPGAADAADRHRTVQRVDVVDDAPARIFRDENDQIVFQLQQIVKAADDVADRHRLIPQAERPQKPALVQIRRQQRLERRA